MREPSRALPAREAREAARRLAPGRCPYCHEDVAASGKPLVACAACGARHHEPCHAEHGACASCGATDVLVAATQPRGGAAARAAPPRGSSIEATSDEEGAQTLSWSWFGPPLRVAVVALLAMATIVLAPLAAWLLFARWRWPLSRVVLGRDTLTIEPGGSVAVYHARREDVGAVRLERIAGQAALRLTVDFGVDRVAIGFGRLKEPELEWLYERLLAWKEGGA